MSDVNIFDSKLSDFVSIPLFGFTLVIKLRNFDFESHWNISLFFDKQRYGVRFEYVPWKNVWFCFISNVCLHFSHETEKFDFKGHWNTSIFSDKKWCQIWLCPIKQCFIWFKLRCLSKILVISWEIWISHFIKIF